MSTKTIVALVVALAVIAGAYFAFRPDNQGNNTETNNTETQNTTNNNNQENNQVTEPTPTPPAASTTAPSSAVVKFETTEGTFEVTLDGKSAPLTVNNFLKLTKEGFYNGLTFHRIEQIEGFRLIQGGDPNGNGTGGPGYTVPAEIKLKHTKGAIAMARTGGRMPDGTVINPEKASSGSQFYIVLEDIPQLDGEYTVFGYVTSGLNTVEKIGSTPIEPGSIPLKTQVINKVSVVKETP
ncbi:MAG TPA: peptidylprolyl isomerase [Candidatus Binatia bacterium]|nr:peptidylprolyl isomerase [Candidatus Binatia bacterium]